MSLVLHAKNLITSLEKLTFSDPVAVTYNPLIYAWENHEQYLTEYGQGHKRVLFLGMNPGPWGMAQTGIPFGEVTAVRDWMRLNGVIKKPEVEHPKRPVEGFSCPRSEVSGRRLWGYFSKKYPDARIFFQDHFVVNYCPLVWMGETGANITPDKLAATMLQPVEKACFHHLKEVVKQTQPQWVIGVGGFAEKRLLKLKKELKEESLKVGKILHPSPASPAANRGWEVAAEKQLTEMGVC